MTVRWSNGGRAPRERKRKGQPLGWPFPTFARNSERSSGLPLHRLGRTVRIPRLAAAAAARTPTTRTTTTRTPATASAATRARRLRVRNLHRDAPTVQLAAIELGDRVLGSLRGVHLDEAESS